MKEWGLLGWHCLLAPAATTNNYQQQTQRVLAVLCVLAMRSTPPTSGAFF